MKNLLKIAAFAIGMLGAGAVAAAPALVTTDLNIRSGPGTNYGAIGVLPSGAIVDVRGCTSGYSWCRVNYQGYDGWASSRYLAHREGRYSGSPFSSSAAAVGIPLIAGVVIGNALSNDRYRYRDRYRGPGRYYDRRPIRRDANRDWRQERRDARQVREWRRGSGRDISREWRRQPWGNPGQQIRRGSQ